MSALPHFAADLPLATSVSGIKTPPNCGIIGRPLQPILGCLWCLTWESGGGPPHSKTLARCTRIIANPQRLGAPAHSATYTALPQTNQLVTVGTVPDRIPKGFRPEAQGWRVCEPTLGYRGTNLPTATRLWPSFANESPMRNGHNRVAVGLAQWTRTQGSLESFRATLGFEPQSLWDCRNGGPSALQAPCKSRARCHFSTALVSAPCLSSWLIGAGRYTPFQAGEFVARSPSAFNVGADVRRL